MSLRRILLPFSWIYRLGQQRDRRSRSRHAYESALPVISVGNLTVGGSGKTPLVMYLVGLLQKEQPVLVLSGGHGRADRGPRIWKPGDPLPDPAQFGDEPALIARGLVHGALGVARDRAGLLRALETDLPEGVVLLDDGFQHFPLRRDLDIVIVDDRTVRNPLPLPAGDLREPLGALARAGVILVTSAAAEELARKWMAPDTPVMHVRSETAGIGDWRSPVRSYSDERVVAVAGIARPERFFDAADTLGADVAARLVYRDHHRYTREDARHILSMLYEHGATGILTTAKDAVKLDRLPALSTVPIFVAHIRPVIWEDARLLAILRSVIRKKRSDPQKSRR